MADKVQDAIQYVKQGHTDLAPLRDLTNEELQGVLDGVRWGYETTPAVSAAVHRIARARGVG